jgi:tetratricopeptide (TPR) repeat protein
VTEAALATVPVADTRILRYTESMHRTLAARLCTALALVALALVAVAPAHATSDVTGSSTIFGPRNPLLADGSVALGEGRYEEGIRLTLLGLEQPTELRDRAAGHSNLCAGYASLRRWEDALKHCNLALELDANNWRTYNNRAAAYVGKGLPELAIGDIDAGLRIAPDSRTLLNAKEIVEAHRRAKRQRGRNAVKA